MATVGYTPHDLPLAYDTLIIGGVYTPGVAVVEKLSRAYKWDIKEGKGSNGGVTTFQGASIPKFSVTIKLWEPEHFTDWEDLCAMLRRSIEGTKVKALNISHPFLQQLDVNAVTVETIGQPTRAKEGDVLHTVTIDFLEYRPPKPTKAKSTATTPAGATDATKSPIGPPKPPPEPLTLEQLKDKLEASAATGFTEGLF